MKDFPTLISALAAFLDGEREEGREGCDHEELYVIALFLILIPQIQLFLAQCRDSQARRYSQT